MASPSSFRFLKKKWFALKVVAVEFPDCSVELVRAAFRHYVHVRAGVLSVGGVIFGGLNFELLMSQDGNSDASITARFRRAARFRSLW